LQSEEAYLLITVKGKSILTGFSKYKHLKEMTAVDESVMMTMEEEMHGRFPQKLSLEWWKLRHPIASID
jgi:hypothetical protein